MKHATELVRFPPLPLRDALVYHLVYHHTLALHINHLIFLHTYLFGMLLLLSSSTLWPVLASASAMYACYILTLTHAVGLLLVLPYIACLGGMSADP